jgi:hypothetical protein
MCCGRTELVGPMEELGTARIEAFSDGVFAIAATLLAVLYLIVFVLAFVSPLGAVILSLALAAFYLPSATLLAGR